MKDRRQRARELARSEDPLRWFETFYREAGEDLAQIPWVDLAPNSHLVSWLDQDAGSRLTGRALKIGCGAGDDAEELTRRGFQTTAFDIAPRAIEICRARFPKTAVEYSVENLLNPPPEWICAFDLVVESYTLQVLPESMRRLALGALARMLRPGGSLLVICRARDEGEPLDAFPWPLSKSELDPLIEPPSAASAHPPDDRSAPPRLWEASFEDFLDAEDPPVRRFRIEYRRGAAPE